MSPSKEIEYAGVFVLNQYNYLVANDPCNRYYICSMPKTFTGTYGSIKKYIRFIFESYRYIKKENFDIIHLHYFFPLAIIPWFIRKKNKNMKLILTVHGSDLYQKMKNSINRKLFKYILKDYDHIICVGKKLQYDFQKTLSVYSDTVLCAGINKKIFFNLHIEKEYDFLFVGTLVDRKGFDIVLKLIEATVHKYKWCVVGTGHYKPEIQQVAEKFRASCCYYEKLDQHELNIIYNKSKWLYFPSRNEPFGLVATECIFAGTPVISSASGGLAEQVKDAVNGYLIHDVENLEESLGLLDRASTMDNERYKRFVHHCSVSNEQFSLEYVCHSLTGLYSII